MHKCKLIFCSGMLSIFSMFLMFSSYADNLPTYSDLKKALKAVVSDDNGGFALDMWATVVDRDGVVKTVVFSSKDRGGQWPGSRAISAQKANTANAFSLSELALSTANLFSAVQPGGSLYGLQHSNPINTEAIYGGNSENIGMENDPMVGHKVGGINVFGGGLPLYNKKQEIIGAIGVSGDSSCADHNIAWKLRHLLALDYIVKGVSATNDDNIVYDITDNISKSGWGHPGCSVDAKKIGEALPQTHPIPTKK